MAYTTLLTTNDAFAVTTSDTTQVSAVGFYVGVAGNVAVMPVAEEAKASPVAVTFVGLPAGAVISLNISRFMATNTTATNIIAFGPK